MWELDYKESWAPKTLSVGEVLEKTLESPLDCKEIQPVHPKGNQSWIFIGRTDAEAEAQYFGHLMQRTDSLEKTLILGKIEDRRRRGQQRMRWLDGITDSMDMSWVSSRNLWWTGRPGVLQSMGRRVGHSWATELRTSSVILTFEIASQFYSFAYCFMAFLWLYLQLICHFSLGNPNLSRNIALIGNYELLYSSPH